METQTQTKTPTMDGMNEYFGEMEKRQEISEKERDHTTRKPSAQEHKVCVQRRKDCQ